MFRIIFIAIFIFVMMTTTACAKSTSYTGTWKSTGDLEFIANIKKNHVDIVWVVDDETSGLYWKGTFPATKKTTIMSIADTEALNSSIFGSLDKSKQFIYKNKRLIFSFSAFGVTKTISLKKV